MIGKCELSQCRFTPYLLLFAARLHVKQNLVGMESEMATWREVRKQDHVMCVCVLWQHGYVGMGTDVNANAARTCCWCADGLAFPAQVTIIGFGSLLSKKSALMTTPSMQAAQSRAPAI